MKYYSICKRLIALTLTGVLLTGICEAGLPVYAKTSDEVMVQGEDAASVLPSAEVNLEDVKSEVYDTSQKQTGKVQDIAGDETSGASVEEQILPVVKQEVKTIVEVFNTAEGDDGQISENEDLVSGTLGEGVTWELTLSTGELIVSGAGEISDYASSPWSDYVDNIQTLKIESGITKIGARAFSTLTSLTEVQIDDGVEKIGFKAFAGCTNLTTINIPLSWNECPSISTAGTINADYCGHIFEGCKKLTSLVVPKGMTELPRYAFSNCNYLENVELPDTLQNISNHVFYKCGKLKEIVIPEGVTFIGKSAFCYCESIQSVTIPEGVTELYLYAFYKCTSLTEVQMADSIEKIGYQAFADCTNLTTINLPMNWKECPTSDTSGTVNADYCGHIFEGCKKLTSLVVPEGMTELPGYAFANCNYLEEVKLPSTLEGINNHVFYKCGKLKEITIPEGVTYIKKSAFCYCESLQNVTIPEGVTELYLYAFYKCTSLTEVKMADSIEKIGYQAFADCSKLTSINIPLNWKECTSNDASGTISSNYCGHIFEGCSMLNTVSVPNGMESLPVYAFCYSDNITTINLPNTLKNIGKAAFYKCGSLTYVDLPEGITTIGEYAFADCIELNAVVFPKSLEQISSNAYQRCKSLVAISIPETVMSIGHNVFESCESLETVYYEGDKENWSNLILNNNDFNSVKVNFGILCDYAEPDCIIESSYTKPESVQFDSFYGGHIAQSKSQMLDVNEATFGLHSKKMYVSLPKDSYITYGFDKALLCPDNAAVLITTTGNENERADIYVQTISGNLIYIGTTYETSERHVIKLTDVNDYIVGVKVVGRDLNGASLGFDIVDLALIAQVTDFEYVNPTKTMVSIKRNGRSYNLLKEEQIIKECSGEEVSILVSPDWGDCIPGTVALVQNNNIIMQNKGGSFVDIKPDEVFGKYGSIFVVLLDENNTIIERKKLLLTISGFNSSRLDATLKYLSLNIYENKNLSSKKTDDFVKSSGAKVETELETVSSDKNGNAKLETILPGTIVVSKDNFVSRTFTASQLMECPQVYLQRKNNSAPVISGVWLGITDVLHYTYPLSMLSTTEITLEAEVDWGAGSYGSIKLVQDNKSVSFSGNSLKTMIGDKFDTSQPIYIVATDAAGNSTKRPVKIQNSAVNKTVDWLDGAGLDFSDQISLTLPSSTKPGFLAGMEIGAELVSTNIPITVSAEDGKISVIFGVELNEISYDSERDEGEKWQTTNIIKKFKETGVFDNKLEENLEDYKNFKKVFEKQISSTEGKFGFEADFSVMGFAEATYDENGNVKLLNGGIIVNPAVEIEKDFPFTIPVGPIVIPLFFETEFSADVEAKLNLIMKQAARKFSPEGELSGDIALSGGLGIGAKKVLYASGGLEGEVNPLWKIHFNEADYFKITASLGGYAKAGIACFEGKLDFPFVEDAVLYETKGAKSINESTVNATYGGFSYADLYDSSNYELKDLSYVSAGSKFLANANRKAGRIAVFALTEEVLEEVQVNEFKTNIYKESTPKIVSLDAQKKLAVWIDTASADINQVYLYYSYFDGTMWTNPEIVCEDGTMDCSPELVRVGDSVYLAWQNAGAKYVASESLTLEEIAGGFDISIAYFDEVTKKFECDTVASEGLDMLPQICGEGENIYAVWINNGANDWFGANDQNSIMYSSLTENGWSEPVTVYENLYSLNSIAADYQEGLKVAYCIDTDENLETSDDLRVYENGEPVTASPYAQMLPQYIDHELFWYSQNNVCSKKLSEGEGDLSSANYQVLDVNGQKALLYTLGEGLNSKVMMSYLNTDTESWDKGVQITDGNGFIGAYHATTEDGNVIILLNNTEIVGDYTSEDPYGESKLMMVEIPEYCDLSVGEIYYAADSFCAGEKMPFIIELTNEGTAIIEETTVEIKDAQGNLLNTMPVKEIIAPGETLETQVYYEIAEDVVEQTIVISAVPTELSDINESNNEKQLELSYERAFVENLSWGYKEDKTVAVTVDVVNRGYHTQKDLQLHLVKDSVDGEVIETKEISSIDPLELEIVSFDVKAEASDVYYLVLTQKDNTEVMDSDFVVIYSDVIPTDNEAEVVRLSGATRYETGYKVADVLKEELGVDQFQAVVVATGKNFADALAGSYLAVQKNAPIILTNGKDDNIATLHTYIKNNVAAGGKVYILGGEGAVPAEVAAIDGYDVVRLSGKSRYETNLAILNEAGIVGDSVIVATGKAFADSLSASAAKMPILLVKPGEALSAEAKDIVKDMKNIYIIGGEGAVSAEIAAELAAYGTVTRVAGKSRYETSVAVAKTFFGKVDHAVAASGKNFPDGLCGGPLAAAMNAPLILTADGKTEAAAGYMAEMSVRSGYVLGGTGALADESVVDVFTLKSVEEIK